MRKRAFALILCIALVFSLATACTPSDSGTTTPTSTGGASTSTASTTPAPAGEFAAGLTGTFKIMVAGEQAEDTIDPVTGATVKGWKSIAEEFVNQNPGATLDFVEVPWADYIAKLQTAAMSGEFDVLHLAAGQNAACGYNKYVLSLNDYIKNDGFDGAAVYGEALWKSGAVYTNENYYGLPKLGYTFTHLYNKQLFDDFGVEYIDINNATWEEILEKAQKLTGINPRTGQQCYGLFMRGTSVTTFYELVQYLAKNTDFYAQWDVESGFTGDISKIDFTIAGNEAIKKGLQWMKAAAACAPAGWVTNEGTENFFTEDGNVAMWMDTDGGGMPKALYDNGDLELLKNYVFFKVPGYEDAARGGAISRSSGNFHTWGIPVSAKNPDASWEIIKFLASEYVSKIAYEQKWLTPVFPSATEWLVPEDAYSPPCISGLSETYNYPHIGKTSAYATFNSYMVDLFTNYATGKYSDADIDGKLQEIQANMEAWRDNAVKNNTR